MKLSGFVAEKKRLLARFEEDWRKDKKSVDMHPADWFGEYAAWEEDIEYDEDEDGFLQYSKRGSDG